MDFQEKRCKLFAQAPGLIFLKVKTPDHHSPVCILSEYNYMMLHLNMFVFLTRSVSTGQLTSFL